MILKEEQVEASNKQALSKHKSGFNFIEDSVNNVDDVIKKLINFQVAIPSWALGTGGTRF